MKKLFRNLGCFTLMAVTCACMLFSVGCSKNEPKREADGSLVVTPGEIQGDIISMLTAYPNADDGSYSITLNVVVDTAYGDEYKKIIWDIYWKNPNSTWASGKIVSDYVILSTPVANGTTAKLNQGTNDYFGEQIIVKATALYDTSISAIATVDCCKEFQDFYLRGEEQCWSLVDGQKLSLLGTLTAVYGVGTVEPTINADYIDYELIPGELSDGDFSSLTANQIKTKFTDVINNILTDNGIALNDCKFNIQKTFRNNVVFDIDNFFSVSSEAIRDKVGYKLAYNKLLKLLDENVFSLKISVSVFYNDYRSGYIEKEAFEDFEISLRNVQPFEIVSNVSFTDGSAIF